MWGGLFRDLNGLHGKFVFMGNKPSLLGELWLFARHEK